MIEAAMQWTMKISPMLGSFWQKSILVPVIANQAKASVEYCLLNIFQPIVWGLGVVEYILISLNSVKQDVSIIWMVHTWMQIQPVLPDSYLRGTGLISLSSVNVRESE